MDVTRRLFSSSILNVVHHLVLFAVALIITPLVIHTLGVEIYGVWVVLMTFFRYYRVLDFGLTLSSSRFLAYAIGKEDRRELRTVASTSFYLFCTIAIVAFIITAIGAVFSSRFFGEETCEVSGPWIVFFYGLIVSTGFLTKTHLSYLKANLRYDIFVVTSLANTLLTAGLIILFLRPGDGIFRMALFYGAGSPGKPGHILIYFKNRSTRNRWTSLVFTKARSFHVEVFLYHISE